MTYRTYRITQQSGHWHAPDINCFGCRAESEVMTAIDRYIADPKHDIHCPHCGRTRKCNERCLCISLPYLLTEWNDYTAPYVMRTTAEHAECIARARVIDQTIRANWTYGRDWKELSNGMRIPV